MSRDKDEPLIPGWDGEAAGWSDYSRRVRLCSSQTDYRKRYTLGPKLVLKLRGKAWEIAASVDHELLESHDGAQYLLRFLRQKLGKLPVPDVGQHLDELFVKMRRAPHTDMVTWCNQLRETYRKLQRALARTMPQHKATGVQTDPIRTGTSSGPTSPIARRSNGSEPQREPPSPSAEQVDGSPTGVTPEAGEDDYFDAEAEEDWDDWYGWYDSSWYSSWYQDDWHWWQGREDDDANQWEDLEGSLPDILPQEVLGWLLLRRSGLSSQARLSIQAASGNSMRLDAIERAMRQQEDELMHQERTKTSSHRHGGGRSYWIEEDGAWGLVLQEVEDSELWSEDQVKWLDASTFAATVVQTSDESTAAETEMSWYSDGWHDWMWMDDEWHVNQGESWVAYSEMRPWMDVEDIQAVDATLGKEVEDLYSTFDQKVRSFREARDLMQQKGKNRGYYPYRPKGFSKGKGKGPGSNPKGKKGSSGSSVLYTSKGKGSGTPQNPGTSGYTGCFICGEKSHSYVNCPKRGQGSNSSSTKPANVVCFVETMETSSPSDVFMLEPSSSTVPAAPSTTVPPEDVQRMILAAAGSPQDPHRLGYAVLDTGATETVGSLQAVEHIMQRRQIKFGDEKVGVDVQRRKRFRFGNAEERSSESYLLLPQMVNGVNTSLGVYTLDVPGDPILVGIRTMEKLGAVISVADQTIEFTKLFPGTKIPLIRGQNKHLLLDLCSDWNPLFEQSSVSACSPVLSHNPDATSSSEGKEQVMARGGVRDEAVREHATHVDVHVVETQSETCSEGSAGHQLEQFMMETSPVLQPILSSQTHLPSSPADLANHGVLQEECHLSDVRRGDEQVCEGAGDGVRRTEVKGTAGHGEVRLGSDTMVRSKGPQAESTTMLGPSQGREIRQGLTQWSERTCSLADMSSLSAPHPDLGVQRLAPQCGSTRQGREIEVGTDQGQRSRSPRVRDQGDWAGCGGGIYHSSLGSHPEPEEGHGQQDWSIPRDQCQEVDQDNRGLEPIQEGAPTASRSARKAGAGGVAEDQGLSDIMPMRSQNASHPQELDEGVFTCTASLTSESREKIVEQLRAAEEECEDALVSLGSFGCDLLEVCCGEESSLTATVLSRGGKAFRIGLGNNMDLSTSIGLERASEFASIVKPRWMWFSTPCGPTSPIQNINMRTPQQIRDLNKKVRKSKKIVKGSRRLVEEQIHRGGHIGWEWPYPNKAWEFHDVKEMMKDLSEKGQCFVARLDGCQVDVRAPDTGNLMLKPWKIFTSSPEMQRSLSMRCNHQGPHEQCMGNKRALYSGMYPKRMCEIMARVILGVEFPRECRSQPEVFGLSDSEELPPIDEQELKRMKEAVRKLHVRSGHPTNRALAAMLKSRGADPRVVKLALEHRCDDCMEVHLPVPHKKVSMHTTETLWHTMQMDIGQFPFEETVIHVLFMIDEASRFLVAHELFRHHKKESMNATTPRIISAIESSWVQYHGLPNVIRHDPEGCFRGILLDEWARSRGVELQPCPGEDHGQIGVVEATIGKIKTDARTFLRSEACDPFVGILQMVSAHNQLDRIGGFAPAQWAYGRLPSLDNRLFEGGNELPVHTSEAAMGTDLRANLNLRVKAEEFYRRSQAVFKINRALNTQPKQFQVFLPGDLVYYRRYKTPLSQDPSHVGLDQSRIGIARWYGPGRVLATETRSETNPPSKKPGSVVWVIAAGRLKRCRPQQLRHCSERERILAESSEAVTTPWSFNSLTHLLERGQFERYDDLEQDEENPSFRDREQRGRSVGRSRSRPRASSQPVKRDVKTSQRPQQDPKRKEEGTVGETKGERRPKTEQVEAPENERDKKKKRTETETVVRGGTVTPSSSAGARSHGSPLTEHPPFQRAQQRNEIGKSDFIEAFFAGSGMECEARDEVSPVLVDIFQVDIPLPETKVEMKRFLKDSESWTTNKMKKGSELKWSQIPRSRIDDFEKAKLKEVNNWIQEHAVKLWHDKVPSDRILKMRWIYTIKSDDSAKARIVLIGYQDPDLDSLKTTAPTMTRRTRGLFLTACSLRGWTALKGDVRAAFLQGLESEEQRSIFAKPVVELAKQLGGDANSYVKIVKACYGLANAPAQWHSSVDHTMRTCGFQPLLTEPCCWRLMDDGELIGLAVAHVDDFLFAGCDQSAVWQKAIQSIYDTYKWSPWESDSYMHCGVKVVQSPDSSFHLNHSEYCANIDQIKFQPRHEGDAINDSEKNQLRAVLGALQWRAYQTGPQHSSRLSQLQSQISSPTVRTLMDANKLVREVYNGRNVGLRYHRIQEEDPLKVTFVAWTDAAVGNRHDLSSSGGYVIAATESKILDGRPCPLNVVSWKAGKLPRIARSSLSAEIQAFSIAEEELMYVRLQWLEMNGVDIPTHDAASVVKQSPGVLVTDAKSLFDVIKKGPQNTSGLGLKEKYSVLDMLSVFQRLSKCQTITRWVHSESQLADAMTKPTSNSSLHQMLISGTWTLVYDETFTSSKNLKKRAKLPAPSKDYGVCDCMCVLEPDLPPQSIMHMLH